MLKPLSAKNKLIYAITSLILALSFNVKSEPVACNWPQWQSFKQDFISQQGRVIDLGSKEDITTSEGQSYALFFALLANDKAAFDRLLKWTEQHLAEGDLSTRLPAWKWGKNKNDQYQILDSNPASDSDLWIAYTLAQAANVWQDRYYDVLASVMAMRILREEVSYIDTLGWTLLPAPYGFENKNSVKLNPSYSPLFISRYFAKRFPDSHWPKLHQSSTQLLLKSTQNGAAADWLNYSPEKGIFYNKSATEQGSYNAIRVYLWNNISPNITANPNTKNDTIKQQLNTHFMPLADKIVSLGFMPEYISAADLSYQGVGPVGFQMAVAPMLKELKPKFFKSFIEKINAGQFGENKGRYYDSVLSLFSQSVLTQRFVINQAGETIPHWLNKACN